MLAICTLWRKVHDMDSIDVPASAMRIAPEARRALAAHRVVEITSHGSTSIVMLHPDDFARVRPMLQRQQLGLPVPIEDLLDDDDFSLLADLRADDGGVGVTTEPSWA